MKKYIIQCETGLQGSAYYNTKAEAVQAAWWRMMCTGLEWIALEVIVKQLSSFGRVLNLSHATFLYYTYVKFYRRENYFTIS